MIAVGLLDIDPLKSIIFAFLDAKVKEHYHIMVGLVKVKRKYDRLFDIRRLFVQFERIGKIFSMKYHSRHQEEYQSQKYITKVVFHECILHLSVHRPSSRADVSPHFHHS